MEYEKSKLPKPFFHSDPTTLEGMISDNESSGKDGAFENIFMVKKKPLKAKINALREEIKIRERLDTHILNNIEIDISRQNTQVMRLRKELDSTGTKMKLKNNILTLRKESKRQIGVVQAAILLAEESSCSAC